MIEKFYVMKNLFWIKLSLGIIISLASCSPEKQVSFIQVKGKQFFYNNKPYYFLGANFWHGAYLGANLVEGDRDRLVKELDQMLEYGITNLRIMVASEASALEMSVRPAFQEAPGQINSNLLVGLDYLLSEMAKRDMKAVLVLNNYWQWSGGMSQYINWVTGDTIIDPDKTGDWDGFQYQSAAFYTNKKANELFYRYIRTLVERENSISGVVYRNDPTIMSWQLANEPRPAPDANTNQKHSKCFSDWINNTANYIRSLDSNHLISSGNEGAGGCRWNIDVYSSSHQSENIDYLTFHIWPKNWGWYDASKPDETFDVTIGKTLEYLEQHIVLASKLDMPIVLEEFGMERDFGGFSPEVPTTFRDKYLDFLFNYVVESAKSGSSMAGLNFWAWGGMAKPGSEDYIWKEGDSFMGDPPQEPQGLNSVFSTDTSTLIIFKKYNDKLHVN
jgi:mannan endo-1,4-beta-mannosidase